MMKRLPVVVAFALLLTAAAAHADKGKKAGDAAGLRAVFDEIQAAHAARDVKKGRELTLALLPDEDALKKVLKDDVPAEVRERILAPFKRLPPGDEAIAGALVAGQGRTQITVHAATTEELIAYKEGTPAYNEFPGGARRLAETVLRPKITFYEVECTEPGKEDGTKYHMFFWDGAGWRMLGPAWRALTK